LDALVPVVGQLVHDHVGCGQLYGSGQRFRIQSVRHGRVRAQAAQHVGPVAAPGQGGDLVAVAGKQGNDPAAEHPCTTGWPDSTSARRTP